MFMAVSRSDGVTVPTLTSDHSPDLRSVSPRPPSECRETQTAFGALWIITGLLHIGLSVILIVTWGQSDDVLQDMGYSPVWLGVLFMFFGVCCVLAERYPTPVLVLLSLLLNLAAIRLSIAAIVWYSDGLDDSGFRSFCRRSFWNLPDLVVLKEHCEEIRDLLRALTSGICAVLVSLSFLDLYMGLTSAILSFKALIQGIFECGNEPLPEEAIIRTIQKIQHNKRFNILNKHMGTIIAESPAKVKSILEKTAVSVKCVLTWILRWR